MTAIELIFSRPQLAAEELANLEDSIYGLLDELYRNEHILTDDPVLIYDDEQVKVYVNCPFVSSMEATSFGGMVLRHLNRLKTEYNVEMHHRVVGKNPFTWQPPEFKGHSLLLWGSYLPLRSMQTFDYLPLYLIPPTDADNEGHGDIYFWKKDFEQLYSLWMRGKVDESRFDYYLSSPDSDFNKQGLALRQRIEEKTGVDCYYSLFNYEREIPVCPSCGGQWELETRLFDQFDYQCDRCKIVSNKPFED